MGIPVLILGESGSGKTASLRNFSETEIGIFSVAGKPLPFKKKLVVAKVPKANPYQYITNLLPRVNAQSVAIDDSQYLMTFNLFARAKEKSYDKFTEIGLSFYNLIQSVINLDDNKIVYFLHHTETTDAGIVKAKTVGKMLDNQLCLEGLFSIVILCKIIDGQHFFITQSDGFSTTKSPMDMLPRQMDNDLKLVDQEIRNYWGLTEARSQAQAPQTISQPQTQQTTHQAIQQQPQQTAIQPSEAAA